MSLLPVRLKARLTSAAFLALVAVPSIIGLQGCDEISVPVGNLERSRADPVLSGVWLASNPDESALLAFIEPYDKRSWLIWAIDLRRKKADSEDKTVGPPVDPAALPGWLEQGDEEVESMGPFKVWLTRLGGERFLVLEPMLQLSTQEGIGADDWYVFRIEMRGNDAFAASMVDPNFQDLDKVTTSRAAEAIIRKNARNPALYGVKPDSDDKQESIPFLRVPQSAYGAVRELLKAPRY
jgi:hypothetical protein